MNLTLNRMEIENFKGVKHLKIDFSDRTDIYGANATGKTSIQDAFTWLLYNKDADGNAPGSDNFREKPLGDDGQEVHNIETVVTASFTLDGKPFNLKRLQRENWVKKRGTATPTFQGNASIYWINDVETKLNDFKAKITDIAPDEVFRLITSLGAFNAMEWKKRRSLLVSMSNADVDGMLLSSDKYESIKEEVEQRGIHVEDLRKVLSDQRKKANAELQLLPARIDEAHRLKPITDEQILKGAEISAKFAQTEIDRLETLIAQAKQDDAGASTRRQILETEADIVRTCRDIEQIHSTKRRKAEMDLTDATRAVTQIKSEIEDAERTLCNAKEQMEGSQAILDRTRSEYKIVYEQNYVQDSLATNCPTCGQSMPQEKVQEARDKAKNAFDAKKKIQLSEVTRRGTAAKEDVAVWVERIKQTNAALDQLTLRSGQADSQHCSAEEALKAIPLEPSYNEPKLETLRARLDALKASKVDVADEQASALKEEQAGYKTTLAKALETLAKAKMAVDIDLRIVALEEQQTELGEKVSAIELKMDLAEEFIADRCKALEDGINDLFPTVKWKLFDRQINGGLIDICNCMIPCNGALVAYSCANTASQVNADIEVSSVLSRHYDVTAPLFLDNAERVNYIANPAGQLITLSVSTDNMLRVEHN